MKIVNQSMKLWYRKPAEKWEEALPIGNGQLGGMVFGGVHNERIQLNEDTLWSGEPREKINKKAYHYLESARELVFQGNYSEAEKLIEEHMVGEDTESYLPLGDLYIEHHLEGEVTNYKRELNLATGITKTEYQVGETTFCREAFISHPDQVVVVRLKSSNKQPISVKVSIHSLLKHKLQIQDESTILLNGQSPLSVNHPEGIKYDDERGLKFQLHMKALTSSKITSTADQQLQIAGVNEIVLLLTAKTNFSKFNEAPKLDALAIQNQCTEWLNHATQLSFHQLKERHIADYQNLYNRVSIQLGKDDDKYSDLPTDERLQRYRENRDDTGLEALYFQFGRYLLITSSRPHTQAANLQGIWNPHIQPPWNSDYTTNINVEMNYWPSEVCNLSECHGPLFDMIEDLSIAGKKAAKELYGANGFVVHHNVDLWRMSTPSSGQASWAFWPMAGAWLTSHLWEHYQFHLNHEFLNEKAYPLMKSAAEFYLDWLIEGPNGFLVTNPSTSPENKFLTKQGQPCAVSYASTMDITLIRELFQNCMEANKILNKDEEFRGNLQNRLDRLPPYQINSDGRLQEWVEDFPEAEPGHRHVSHLYGLYPGNQINDNATPELLEAAKKSLQFRLENGGGHTGWSCAWLINLFARLKEQDNAYTYVQTLLARSTHPNLFDDHPPFQIDGNFGGTAGIAEMLLQSHLNQVELLPALPEQWNTGFVKGLCARGGYEIDIEWSEGKLKKAILLSKKSSTLHIKYHNEKLRIEKSNGAIHIGNVVKMDENEKVEITVVSE